MKKNSKLLANVILCLFTAVICLTIFEVALRLTLYHFKPYAVSPGPNSTYPIERAEFKTMITTNSLNMRDREVGPKPAGERRILCLGDSFTFGLGVDFDDTYPQKLEKELRQAALSYRVLNGSTGGNAVDALKFLNEKGLSFNPDMVIVQSYIGNDLYDGMRFLPASASQNPSQESPNIFLKAKEGIRGIRLCTIDFLWNRLIQVPWIDDLLFQKNIRYGNRAVYLKDYPELELKLMGIELDALEKIRAICDKEGIRLLLIIIPTREQVFKKKFLMDAKYDYRTPDRMLKSFCKVRNIAFVDFLELYEALPEATTRPFYYAQDEHWTVKGQMFAAQTLSKVVQKL